MTSDRAGQAAFFVLALLASSELCAEDQPLRPRSPGHNFGEIADPTVWPTSSVGAVTVTLNASRTSFCTGTLVARKVVLTAAHCLYFGGSMVQTGAVRFLAGLNRGTPAAQGAAARFVVPEGFRPADASYAAAVDDWALIVLKEALDLQPVPVRAIRGAELAAVVRSRNATQIGYGRDRRYLPSIVRDCRIAGSDRDGLIAYSCLTNFGYSGAPIFVDLDGSPFVIAIGSRGDADVSKRRGVAVSAERFEKALAVLAAE